MDKLSQHLSDTGQSLRQFATKSGISVSFLSEIMSGAKSPSLEMALKIQGATGGHVGVSDWPKFAAVARALGNKDGRDSPQVQGSVTQ